MMGEIAKIQFHGAELLVQRGDTPETTFVAMKPVVEGMGLNWASQFTKLKGHPVLSKGVVEIATPSAGGDQLMTALPLNRLHFWLATLHPNKIPDLHIREKVILFQHEAADALFDRFFGRAIERGGAGELVTGLSEEVRRVIGGLIKRNTGVIIREALNDLLPAMVEKEIAANARVAALEYVSVRDLLLEAKAMEKGRGRLNRKIGWELRTRALLHKPPIECRRCPHSGVWLFPRQFAFAFMGEIGLDLVREHNDSVVGQGVLHLVRKPRPGPAQ